MDVLEALFLGLIQGLTEFLPVSSSGHLLLLEKLGIGEPDLFFNLSLHVGTLAAAAVYYRKLLFESIKKPFSKRNVMLLSATAVTAVLALVFKSFFREALEGKYLSVGFMATAVVLYGAETFSAAPLKRAGAKGLSAGEASGKGSEMGLRAALLTGLAQGIAVFPGLSRSGATISTLLIQGTERREAADFSFLLSMPIIAAGAAAAAVENKAWDFSPDKLLCVFAGFAAAAVSGYFAVKFFVKIVGAKSMKFFAFYTAILSCVSLFFI